MSTKEQHTQAVKLIDGLDEMHNILEGLRSDLETYLRSLEEIMGDNEINESGGESDGKA